MNLQLGKFSIGMGDRFSHQGKAQLQACRLAAAQDVEVIPVWNKSNREHLIVGSEPGSLRLEADEAVRDLGWDRGYHVDADHIRLETVDRFLPHSDFFTIDVADSIGQHTTPEAIRAFLDRHGDLVGEVALPGLPRPLQISRSEVEKFAGKYLVAVQEAGRIYRHIAQAKGPGTFITEVSMDETDQPQTPPELLVILAALADEAIPLQTIAPKFTGRFNKGVDYVGDLVQFEKEIHADLAVVTHAIASFGLPGTLKLSIHSGSDKFSIYPIIRRALDRFHAGVHLKTAGTTWLEELIGLAESGGAGLDLAREVYAEALAHVDDLCAPYASVIDIDRTRLPKAATVAAWTGPEFVAALRHDPSCPEFNPHLRQLLHVGYKVAAQMGARYLRMLEDCESAISRNVTHNLFHRHIQPLFLGVPSAS